MSHDKIFVANHVETQNKQNTKYFECFTMKLYILDKIKAQIQIQSNKLALPLSQHI